MTHQRQDWQESMQYQVFCLICGHGWLEQDPGVTFLYVDHVWTCTDEAMCFERRAALLEVGGDG